MLQTIRKVFGMAPKPKPAPLPDGPGRLGLEILKTLEDMMPPKLTGKEPPLASTLHAQLQHEVALTQMQRISIWFIAIQCAFLWAVTFSELSWVNLAGTHLVSSHLVSYIIAAAVWITLIVMASVIVTLAQTRALHRLIRERLAKSGLFERILLDPHSMHEIYERTPEPFRLVFMGTRPRDIRGQVKLLANNLDWFLNEPRTHFRLAWVGAGIWCIYAVALIALNFVEGAGGFNRLILILLTGSLGQFIYGAGQDNRRVMLEYLIPYFRERLES